jgi:hypothetical protein
MDASLDSTRRLLMGLFTHGKATERLGTGDLNIPPRGRRRSGLSRARNKCVFLLDTNVVSEFLKVRPHGGVLGSRESVRGRKLHISALTLRDAGMGREPAASMGRVADGRIDLSHLGKLGLKLLDPFKAR